MEIINVESSKYGTKAIDYTLPIPVDYEMPWNPNIELLNDVAISVNLKNIGKFIPIAEIPNDISVVNYEPIINTYEMFVYDKPEEIKASLLNVTDLPFIAVLSQNFITNTKLDVSTEEEKYGFYKSEILTLAGDNKKKYYLYWFILQNEDKPLSNVYAQFGTVVLPFRETLEEPIEYEPITITQPDEELQITNFLPVQPIPVTPETTVNVSPNYNYLYYLAAFMGAGYLSYNYFKGRK